MSDNRNNTFLSHFREFIEALNNKKIMLNIFLYVIGGYTVGAYGHIRGKFRDSEDLTFLQKPKENLFSNKKGKGSSR